MPSWADRQRRDPFPYARRAGGRLAFPGNFWSGCVLWDDTALLVGDGEWTGSLQTPAPRWALHKETGDPLVYQGPRADATM